MESRRLRVAGAALAFLLGVAGTLVWPAAHADEGEPAEKPAAAEQPGNKPAAEQPAAQPAPPNARIPLRLRAQVPIGRALAPQAAVALNPQGDLGEESVLFARDREAEQLLKRARTFLEENRYGEAARALGAIIEAPEDFFFQPDEDAALHRSLKSEAQRLLGELGREGKQSYELQFGPRADELLRQALSERDWNLVAEVSRRFFHTEAGYRATYLLGLYQLDHQRPLAAALCLARLKQAGQPAMRFEPTLSLQLANAWYQAGQVEATQEALRRLKEELPDAKLVVAGDDLAWFGSAAPTTTWLTQHFGMIDRATSAGTEQWTMHRGNPQRNATLQGGAPLLDREGDCWWIPTVDEPAVERIVRQLRQTYQDANFTALPAFQPLVIDDVVLMRTVSTLLAIDFQTGKRLWNVPVDENWGDINDLQGSVLQQGSSSQVVSLIDQRMWDDATYGNLASDGEYVFSVEDLNFNLPGQNAQPKMVVLPNGRRLPAPAWPRNFNRLAAHEIRTGKLKWEVGGTKGEYELDLAGAFFLGPPLPLLDTAYALAEINGEIRLVALDARTGRAQWGQQLAVVEMDVLQDPARRFSGASPSYSDGVIVCPTGSGAIVAVDLTNRSLLWGYRYETTIAAQPTVIGRRIGAVMMFAGRPRDEADRWMDSSPTIAAGKVIVTPVESNEIHCLNLLDGSLQWKRPRGSGLYVAGVHNGRVVLVSRNGMQALSLETGAPTWESELQLPSGATPSGRGFLSGDEYYLPLSTGEVATVSLATGKITDRSRSRGGNVPGNLVAYRGRILSQTAESLDVYFELNALKRQVADTLDRNQADPPALARRGALALHDGDTAAAVADLSRSYELAPNDRTRDLLVDALFEGLTADFEKYAEAGAQLDKLVHTPAQRSQYIRVMSTGLQKQGRLREAFDLLARLADPGLGPAAIERTSESVKARRDQWARAGLQAIYQSLGEQDRKQIDAQIESRVAEALAAPGPEPIKQAIRYLGFHPATQQARMQLAQRLSQAGDWLATELLWRQIAAQGDSATQALATANLALAMQSAGRPEAAAYYASRLERQFADQPTIDGKLGSAIVAELSNDPAIDAQLHPEGVWPTRRVVSERDDRQSPTTRYFAAEVAGPSEIYPKLLSVEMSQDRQTLVGRDGNGQERWRASLADSIMRHNINPSVLQARTCGNLVIVSLGQQILAIDTLSAGTAGIARVLWMQELSDSLPGIPNQVGVHVRQIELQWGQRRNLVSDGFGRPVGVLGALSSEYCCFQRGREILAVEPISGETLWTRSDIEPASEIFGDDELVFVVPPSGTEALVLSAVDGRELGRRPVVPFNQRVLTLGRKLLSWHMDAGQHKFKMTDVWEQTPLWEHQFAGNSKAYQVDSELLGVVDPKGRFVAIDLADGKQLIDCEITPEPRLNEIYLLNSRDRLLLFTNRPWTSNRDGISVQAVPGVLNNPLLTGMAYGFDRHTGQKLWEAPIDKLGLALDQPRELPVLVFASRVYEKGGASGNEPYMSIMCLDTRRGAVVHQETMKGAIPLFEVAAVPDQQIVELKLLRHSVRMKFTDEPEEEAATGEQAKSSAADTDAPEAK